MFRRDRGRRSIGRPKPADGFSHKEHKMLRRTVHDGYLRQTGSQPPQTRWVPMVEIHVWSNKDGHFHNILLNMPSGLLFCIR